MSSQDKNGFLNSFRNGFPIPSEDDLPHSDQGESMFPCSSNGGNGCHASPNLPPPPPQVTLPTSRFPQVKRYEITQALLAHKHQDGNFICARILKKEIVH